MSRYEFDCKCEYEQECKDGFVCKVDSWKLISLENLIF